MLKESCGNDEDFAWMHHDIAFTDISRYSIDIAFRYSMHFRSSIKQFVEIPFFHFFFQLFFQ